MTKLFAELCHHSDLSIYIGKKVEDLLFGEFLVVARVENEGDATIRTEAVYRDCGL